MVDREHLLVPIKVQALVIDKSVIDKSGVITEGQKYIAGDGKWSPAASNYNPLVNMLSVAGPRPFYAAGHTYNNKATDRLVLPANSSALPKMDDRGVYLHWVLPPGLRHAYKPGSLDFPALPDQWLVVRFCRRNAKLQTKAWFIDSSLVVGSTGSANLIVASGDKYEARRVGKVVQLEDFTPAGSQEARTVITAIGNQETGSPTFTASVAENRNILSWHDNLRDLREQTSDDRVPTDTALSYLLLGWYHNKQKEPLATIQIQLADENALKPSALIKVLEPLGWRIESASPLLLDDLKKRRCIFHGMVAHINYWSSETYKGPMLGYPGSPSVGGVLGGTPPSFKVGVGNNAEDALVSLVSSEYSRDEDAADLWKALEAVIYHQPESLIGSWNTAPRDHAVHQNWFSTVEAGKVWSIRPRSGKEGASFDDPTTAAALKQLNELQSAADAVTAAQTAAKPTRKQLDALKQINELQSSADAMGRELAALQQDLYARWWKLAERSRFDKRNAPKAEADACDKLIKRVSALHGQRAAILKQLQPLPEELKKKLPEELELRSDAAPRFWTPTDPVIVIKNCGLPTKHQFPSHLPCRLPEQIVTAAEVVVATTKSFNTPEGVTEIAFAAQRHFAPHSEVLTGLLKEASLVEQATSDLADRTLPAQKQFNTDEEWQTWTERLVKVMNWDGKSDPPNNQIRFGKSGALNVLPYRLAELWVQQPWSPLFLDWEVTWYPSSDTGQGFDTGWQMGEYDYKIVNKQPLPTKGYTIRGRSLLAPVDGRILAKPIETLRELLKDKSDADENGNGNPAFPAAVTKVLSHYRMVWDGALRELASAGLMSQALTGFHQTLLRRDVTLPRVMPDRLKPWIVGDYKPLEEEVEKLLDMSLDGERLAPPAHPPALTTPPPLAFTNVRAGALRLNELWLVDDFGQWADLLHGTSAGGAAGQVFHPRARWHDDPFVIAMPPRVVQPVRLNFRFTAADNHLVESDSDPALSPICGWIFYNPLDRVLVLCDRDGQLMGELVSTEEGQNLFRVNWQAGAGGVALDKVSNDSLRAFAQALIEPAPAQALVEPAPTTTPKLHDLLKLIDRALERIRPAAARRDAALFGRPLALVSAMLGLELFGKAWADPRQPPVADRPEGMGDAVLDALTVRVNLGCSNNIEDGLVGYFKDGNYNRIVPAPLLKKIETSSSGYIGDAEKDVEHVGFRAQKPLTLLMDPWGSVQAAAGLVPAKTITLAQAELDKTLAKMETSFRVGPVLLQADRIALPTPSSDKGRWSFCGPLTDNTAAAVIPSDTSYFSDHPVVATEGRLLLTTEE